MAGRSHSIIPRATICKHKLRKFMMLDYGNRVYLQHGSGNDFGQNDRDVTVSLSSSVLHMHCSDIPSPFGARQKVVGVRKRVKNVMTYSQFLQHSRATIDVTCVGTKLRHLTLSLCRPTCRMRRQVKRSIFIFTSKNHNVNFLPALIRSIYW